MSWLDGKTVEFSRDVTEGTLSPTVLVEIEWWNLKDAEVVSEAEAATVFFGLIPTEATIPE